MGRRRAALLGALVAAAACTYCGANGSPVGPGGSPAFPPINPNPIPAPTPQPTQIFAGAGDIAMCDATGDEGTAALLDGIGGTVFALGDNAYPSGRTEDYRECYNPSWGRHLGRTRPVPGNHDYESPGAGPYFQHFGTNAGPPGLGYYSFDLGAWHIIALNSEAPAQINSAQGLWLQNDLATYANFRCTLAMWHRPLFTSGANGDNADMRDLWRLLYAAGVDVVLNGHDHDYERFALQDPDGRPDPARGIREFVVGTGGGALRQFTGLHANSEARVALSYGVLKLFLQNDSYGWEFVPVSGGSDTGMGTCH